MDFTFNHMKKTQFWELKLVWFCISNVILFLVENTGKKNNHFGLFLDHILTWYIFLFAYFKITDSYAWAKEWTHHSHLFGK